jgi:hypothetical protein
MRCRTVRISAIAGLLFLGLAAGRADADVCITVDEARDTFLPPDRAAALLLLARQFELAGERVVPGGCPTPYSVSHVQLGNTIAVTLSGPNGHRDLAALTMDDVPAVYSQMVRSLLTGRPMNGRDIVDRTNVSAAQAAPLRVGSDSVWYARLGYGGIFGDRTYGGPTVGLLGYRKELDRLGIDVSFMNFQGKMSDSYYGTSGMSGSWLKLEALHFRSPLANESAYFGGGLSVGSARFGNWVKSWTGGGLQGELTAGYELGRASTIRLFVQADASLPFYTLRSDTYSRAGIVSTDYRYAPSLTVSMGLGWQRGERRRR